MKRYANLHTHTEYSNIRLLDSINKVELVIDRAIELGMSGVAITDHEALGSHVKAIKHYKKLAEQGKVDDFKLALGDEIYLVDDLSQKKLHHFIVVAKNRAGYELLKEISSTAWLNSNGDFRVPIKKEQLLEIVSKDKGNLVGATACLGGELPTLIMKLDALEKTIEAIGSSDDLDLELKSIKRAIVNFVKFGKELFGDDYYFEVQPSSQPEQIIVNRKIKQLAKVFGVKIIVSTDAHYLKKEERDIHKAYLNSKDGDREVDSFYESAYLMSSQEVAEWQSICDVFTDEELNVIFENTNNIMDGVEIFDLYEQQSIPEIDLTHLIPQLRLTNADALKMVSNYPSLSRLIKSDDNVHLYWIYKSIDFLKKQGKTNEVYLSRLEEEASELFLISENMGFNMFSYYTTMSKIVEICWHKGDSLVGPGRGSANGFLSCYALEITQDDPIIWELPAWRHISSTRPELPRYLGK